MTERESLRLFARDSSPSTLRKSAHVLVWSFLSGTLLSDFESISECCVRTYELIHRSSRGVPALASRPRRLVAKTTKVVVGEQSRVLTAVTPIDKTSGVGDDGAALHISGRVDRLWDEGFRDKEANLWEPGRLVLVYHSGSEVTEKQTLFFFPILLSFFGHALLSSCLSDLRCNFVHALTFVSQLS